MNWNLKVVKTSIPGKKQKKGKLAHITAQKYQQNLHGQLINMLQGRKQVFRHSSVVIVEHPVIIIVHFTITESHTVYYVCCRSRKAEWEKGPKCEEKRKRNREAKRMPNVCLSRINAKFLPNGMVTV